MKRALLLLLLTTALTARAEDWTTTDGTTYKDVTVVKVDDDAVTILYADGGGVIPLSRLPAELQARFHYDAAKARIAAAARAQSDKEIARVLQAEADLRAASTSPSPAKQVSPIPAGTSTSSAAPSARTAGPVASPVESSASNPPKQLTGLEVQRMSEKINDLDQQILSLRDDMRVAQRESLREGNPYGRQRASHGGAQDQAWLDQSAIDQLLFQRNQLKAQLEPWNPSSAPAAPTWNPVGHGVDGHSSMGDLSGSQ